MLTQLTVLVISQYIPIPNHYVVYLKLMQCCISILSLNKTGKNREGTRMKRMWSYKNFNILLKNVHISITDMKNIFSIFSKFEKKHML